MVSPIAPIERILADEIDRAGDIASIAAALTKDMLAHGGTEASEKFAGEIGRAPFAGAGICVKEKTRPNDVP